jgi:hypothetical protein
VQLSHQFVGLAGDDGAGLDHLAPGTILPALPQADKADRLSVPAAGSGTAAWVPCPARGGEEEIEELRSQLAGSAITYSFPPPSTCTSSK